MRETSVAAEDTGDSSLRGTRDLRRLLKTAIGLEPRLYYPLEARLRPRHRGIFTCEQTDLVLEGYPRSGNTFAVAAFRSVQPYRVRIAHHLHVPAQVVQAARLGKPAVVLVRRPDDAVLSNGAFSPDVSLSAIVWGYLAFYRRILPLRESFVLATFDECTTDLGRVIDAVNRRFATGFARFDHTAETAATVMEQIRTRALEREGEGWGLRSSVPTRQRRVSKERLVSGLHKEPVRSLLRRAFELYDTLLATGTSR